MDSSNTTARTWQTTAEFVARLFQGGARRRRAKGDIQTLVKACYNIDVSREDHEIYPEYVCLKCFVQMYRIKAAKGTRYINPTVNLFDWQPPNDSCEVCEHFSKCMKGGRPKKSRKNRGRVAGETSSQTVASVRGMAEECLVTAAVNPSRVSVSQVDDSHLVCPLCRLVANGPVQLACERLACAECVVEMLLSKGLTECMLSQLWCSSNKCSYQEVSEHGGRPSW